MSTRASVEDTKIPTLSVPKEKEKRRISKEAIHRKVMCSQVFDEQISFGYFHPNLWFSFRPCDSHLRDKRNAEHSARLTTPQTQHLDLMDGRARRVAKSFRVSFPWQPGSAWCCEDSPQCRDN